MYDFLDKLITVALPRVKDFRGLSKSKFDGRGNYAFGIKEHLIFPEISVDKIDAIRGMETPVVDQIEFHVGYMQTGAVDYCHRHNIVVEAWAPLGRGKLVENEDVVKIAKKYNVSTAQVLLKFCLQHDVLPIAKSSNYSRMKANMDLFDFELEDEDLNALRAVPDKTGWSGEHPDLAIPKLVIEDEE